MIARQSDRRRQPDDDDDFDSWLNIIPASNNVIFKKKRSLAFRKLHISRYATSTATPIGAYQKQRNYGVSYISAPAVEHSDVRVGLYTNDIDVYTRSELFLTCHN